MNKDKDPKKTTLTIEFNEVGHEAVARLKTGNDVTTKTIVIAELVAELSHDLEITTGILPNGTRFYSGTKNVYRIGIQVPTKIRTTEFHLHDLSQAFTVPFPEMLFVFGIKEKRIINSMLFACIPPIGRPHDRLYLFPFGNVWEDGRICWGKVPHASIEEPIVLDTMVTRFFGSVFSGHLISGTNTFYPPQGVVNLQTLLEHLSGQEHFPDNILKPSNITIGKAMSDATRECY